MKLYSMTHFTDEAALAFLRSQRDGNHALTVTIAWGLVFASERAARAYAKDLIKEDYVSSDSTTVWTARLGATWTGSCRIRGAKGPLTLWFRIWEQDVEVQGEHVWLVSYADRMDDRERALSVGKIYATLEEAQRAVQTELSLTEAEVCWGDDNETNLETPGVHNMIITQQRPII